MKPFKNLASHNASRSSGPSEVMKIYNCVYSLKTVAGPFVVKASVWAIQTIKTFL